MLHFVAGTMLSTGILFQDYLPKLFIALKAFQILPQHVLLHPCINPPSNIQRLIQVLQA